ncbi:hypothetical protein [Nostoc sp. UHCC 0251]|uniref:hypothetical protein n=1 Tax=Nostoc sp. UHCC 0251 TaxID=3110240 RepID=UPI002B1F64F3|nr:hypothetical protein [Nostoc sp. UHCC 0251]MEA5625326.1 hypothetical protein [Nostoc sp. UHCC 0251]
MSQIVGTLLDSAGNPLTGKLVVVLAGNLIDDTTTPDTIYLPQSYTFDIVDGDLDIDLQESETSRITYNFQFFKTDTEGEIIEPALIKFDALVPNVSPVQFAALTPTGLVNDVIDTGSLRVARIISTTPALAQSIGGPFPRGTYDPSTTYKFRDLVSYLNRTYISQDLNPITGVAPTVTTSWMNIPVEPDGSLILADATPYGVAWNASGKSASQDAVYDEVETVKTNVALKENLVSPIFSGDVIVPNQTLGDAYTKAANTNFVAAGLADNVATTNAALALKAPLVSPTFTGTPLVPTAPVSTNTTQAASTAFVKSSVATFTTNLASATIQGNNVDVNTLSITCALGSNTYRFAVVKARVSTSGFSKSLAILTTSLRNNAGTQIESSISGINNVSYLDNSTTFITAIHPNTFTGNYNFSLWLNVNAATNTDVYTITNLSIEVLFFA